MTDVQQRLLILSVSAVLLIALAAFVLVLVKDRTYFHSPSYVAAPDSKPDVLVVYYSRSGHTELMARTIASYFKADILRLETETYGLNFKGWREATNDASKKKQAATIQPATTDLSSYRLVLLGSPIWLFRPAPPLWTFVDNNDLHDKRFVLFNTFNSRFKEEEIDLFADKIAAKGGKLIEHIYVRRGRVYYQKTGAQVAEETLAQLESRSQGWLSP